MLELYAGLNVSKIPCQVLTYIFLAAIRTVTIYFRVCLAHYFKGICYFYIGSFVCSCNAELLDCIWQIILDSKTSFRFLTNKENEKISILYKFFNILRNAQSTTAKSLNFMNIVILPYAQFGFIKDSSNNLFVAHLMPSFWFLVPLLPAKKQYNVCQ